MKKLILFLMMLSLLGCSVLRKNAIQLSNEDAKNAVTSRIVAKEILSTWSLNSGFMTPALETFKGLLPCDCEQDIKAMDAIVDKSKMPDGTLNFDKLDDRDLGSALWYWAKIYGSIIKSGAKGVIDNYFPSILKYLPAAMGF
jgi:hypothetical protein